MAKQREFSGAQKIKPILTGAAVGLVATALMLFLFSVLITMRDIPQGLVDPMAVVALMTGAFAAGLVCTRITRSGGLFYGALCGAFFAALVLLAGLVGNAAGIGLPGLFRVVLSVISAMIGGVIGANLRERV